MDRLRKAKEMMEHLVEAMRICDELKADETDPKMIKCMEENHEKLEELYNDALNCCFDESVRGKS